MAAETGGACAIESADDFFLPKRQKHDMVHVVAPIGALDSKAVEIVVD